MARASDAPAPLSNVGFAARAAKLAPFRAIYETFSFTIRNWRTVFQITWLPLLLVSVPSAMISPYYLEALLNVSTAPNAGILNQAYMSIVIWGGLSFLLSVYSLLLMSAGLLRFALRDQRPTSFFYLGFGTDELRLLGTWSLGYLILILIYLTTFGLVALTSMLSYGLGVAGGILTLVLAATILVGFVWICLRLSLSTPAAVIGKRIGLGLSWRATKYNTWPLLIYWIILALTYIVWVALWWMTYLLFHPGVEIVDVLTGRVPTIDTSSLGGIVWYAVSALVGAFATAVWTFAGATAWRAITISPDKESMSSATGAADSVIRAASRGA
jgi:hypothetical protein